MKSIEEKVAMPEVSWEGTKEFFSLLWVNIVVKKRNFFEYLKVVTKYYSNPSFAKADIGMLLTYLFDNPFSISKRFLMQRGEENIYQYGETPLTTLDYITEQCQITSKDKILELGCGRGRTCFWLSQVLGAQVVGVEYVEGFTGRAKRLKKKCSLKNISFECQDMIETDFSDFSVVYLYGSTLSNSYIKQLSKKMEELKPGSKVITVSYSLQDYSNKDTFEIMRHFSASFTWGEADVYLHIRK